MIKKLCLLGVFFCLTGCIGTSYPSQFYMLTSVDSQTPVSQDVLTVGVETVRIPVYLDRPQLVLKESGNPAVSLLETQRWAESVSAQIQRVVVTDLSGYLPRSFIKPRLSSREIFDRSVVIEISRFDGALNQPVVLSGWWSLQDKTGRMISQYPIALEEQAGTSYVDYVQTQSRLLDKLAYEIAVYISQK